MKITAILPWFGGKRTLAPTIIEQLGKHQFYFEAFGGSMAVLLAKDPCEHEMVCERHGGMTNLANVLQDNDFAIELFNLLQKTLYCDEVFQKSNAWLENTLNQFHFLDWAYHYFIASWMGRNGVSGTERVNYQMATRWTKGGGSGPLRFRNAVDSIPEWVERLKNVHILNRDIFDVLPKIEDDNGVAIYADPPYLPETMSGNSRYLHDFSEEDHERLAIALRRFQKARVVVSYYDSPRLNDLYVGWVKIDCSMHKHLHVQNKRGSERKEAPEVLLVNGPSYANQSSDLFSTEAI